MPVLDQPTGCTWRRCGERGMIFRSTRGTQQVSLDAALVQGLAQDGGLFLPRELPQFDTDNFTSAKTAAETAQILLRPFFSESALVADLDAITRETFRFRLPVTKLPVGDNYAGLLELYHGPTAAFKDVGAGFLAACLGRLQGDTDNPLTILVATSGDTGGAVAAAFNERPGMRVVVLYPDGRVSERQAHQPIHHQHPPGSEGSGGGFVLRAALTTSSVPYSPRNIPPSCC